MKTFTLAVKPRSNEKPKNLRKLSRIPCIVYGSAQKSVSVEAPLKELRSLVHGAGRANLVDMVVEGTEKPIKVIIHDTQYDPLSDEISHVDFYAIDMKKKITTTIPVKLVGESDAIRTLGGMLITNKNEITIKCLPGDLIPFVEADISTIKNFHDAVKVKDLKLPEAIEVMEDKDQPLAHVEEQKVEVYEEITTQLPEGVAEAAAAEGAAAEGAAPAAEGAAPAADAKKEEKPAKAEKK